MAEIINILIIEPNALIRQTLHRYFRNSQVFKVIGKAHDAKIANIRTHSVLPDIIIFDYADSHESNLNHLKNIFSGFFIPILFFSTKSLEEVSQIASELGSLDWSLIEKPNASLANETTRLLPEIEKQLRELYLSSIMRIENFKKSNKANRNYITSIKKLNSAKPISKQKKVDLICDKVISIGASTGGTTALLKIFSSLPKSIPGIVAVIHMPIRFTGSFAARLDKLCEISIVEAKDRQEIKCGQVIIARGDRHLRVKKIGNRIFTELGGTEQVNGHCPSVDVLFKSIADELGASGVGVILTGMGKDGAAGLGEIMRSGGLTIAQDEGSSAVYGMPKAAVDDGAVQELLPLDKIASRLAEKSCR